MKTELDAKRARMLARLANEWGLVRPGHMAVAQRDGDEWIVIDVPKEESCLEESTTQ
jgi:hypothetical protein